ncbi:uncharacterized protein [Narcine bancroftii]|uniref:uncharacterized protein n=1 Tax=Narcine bancroftii TaxID=1343680 RepID=UPI003831DF8C
MNWGAGKTRGKDKKKMIQYCCHEWPENPIKGYSVFWPKYGSVEDWVCQALNTWLYEHRPEDSESRDYAACWLFVEFDQMVMNTRDPAKSKEQEPLAPLPENWDPLQALPPPYPEPALPLPSPPRPLYPPLPMSATPTPPGLINENEQENTIRTKLQAKGPPPPLTPQVYNPDYMGLLEEQCEKLHEEKAGEFALRPRHHKEDPVPSGAWGLDPSQVQMFPLREVPLGGPGGGIGFVNVLLTSTEVRNFKREMKSLTEDPQACADQLDQFLGPNIYTWDELMSIFKALFSLDERGMIRQAGIRVWDREHQGGPGAVAGEDKFPLVNLHWDKGTVDGRTRMEEYRVNLIKGVRESVPKGQNFKKAFEVSQGPEETPSAFLTRLQAAIQQYGGLDIKSPVGEQLVLTGFVTNSAPDI